MKKYKINEIFYSLQGEGYYTGYARIFIRFANCNLKCDFCDTEFEKFELYDIETILSNISQFPCNKVVLTGGEPTLQINESFVKELKNSGYIVSIETNGTNEIPKNIDWITVSPKENWKIRTGDEIKYLIDIDEIQENLQLLKIRTNFKHYFLQPVQNEHYEENLKVSINFIKENPEWKLSIQTHKLLKIQ